ncbi:MAG: 2-C-methyl-D-erythritol 4-phosphate cytidylyltransferase [Deltaproteobacteria bacterium]
MSRVFALVPAAGVGARMNAARPKPLLEIADTPIVVSTLEALARHPLIEEIVLVFSPEGLGEARDLVKRYKIAKVSRVIAGGATRKDSVRNGLEVVPSRAELVLIHDGVRPFVDEACITRVIEAAREGGAAVLGVPVKATVKRVDKRQEVDATLRREQLWEIQTPQVFERELIQKAYLRASRIAAPDDASLVEAMGKRVRVVMGSYFNIKITTQEDLVFAEAIAGFLRLGA